MEKIITNILTFDVEDYFQVSNFEKVVGFENWGKYPARVEKNTDKILDILNSQGVKATFFVLGWIAEKFPGLVKKIASQGHEIASHGYNHRLVYDQTPEEFREDIRKTKKMLEGLSGAPVVGYRAASFSITRKSLWALEILKEEGFRYDSSIFPIHHNRGGLSEAQRYPYKINEEKETEYLYEFPLSTVQILGQNIPFSGGGYFRLLPYNFIKPAIKKVNSQGYPVIMYMHPWELDPEQPRIKTSFLNSFRHYVNMEKAERKLNQILKDFKFGKMVSELDNLL